jgi:hypothetical protein
MASAAPVPVADNLGRMYPFWPAKLAASSIAGGFSKPSTM